MNSSGSVLFFARETNTIIFTMISRTFILLLALFATASAFVPSQNAAFGAKSALSMASAPVESKNSLIAAAAGVVPAIFASSAALATEGTGEWYGVDDLRLLGVLFIGHWFILTLWFQQYKNYDESEDFFGEIDYTTAKK